MAPKADKSKSHTHSMHWVMKLRGRRAGSRRKLRKGRGGGAAPPSLKEHRPTGSNPCWGTCSPTSPSILSWWLQGPRTWPNADPPCPEFELSKKRSSFSKHDEKRKVRNCELSRSDVSNHQEETSPQSGRMTNPTTRSEKQGGRCLRLSLGGQKSLRWKRGQSDFTVPNYADKGTNCDKSL